MAEKEKDEPNELDPEKTQKQPDKPDSDNIIPEEILDAFPEEERGRVASIIKQTVISGVMRRGNPIADKITADHITQLISKSEEQDKRDRKERSGERNYNLILIIIGLLFGGFLIVFLQGNENLLINLIIAIISFVGGFGFGRTKKDKSG